MEPLTIIEKYYDNRSRAYDLLVNHSKMVTAKALKIAESLKSQKPDLLFIEDAAMIHDIGIFLTNAPKIGCHGDKPYICHGYLGREIIEREGFPIHALVCERHIGAGISLEDIKKKHLPLPKRDMLPVSIEEQIICFADKFFSKDPDFLFKEKPVEMIRQSITKFGDDKLKIFEQWLERFGS
jgi:uncharacterized protein